MAKTNDAAFRFVFYEDILEGSTEISVYPENDDTYRIPDIGDTIVIPDLDDTNSPILIESVYQEPNTHHFEITINQRLDEECAEGTQLYIQPR